uniref:Protein kinase domain-containing protein n=1 Tax=Ditylenchus dipsaci TaxID=166011 RepID=A0A915DCF1_9BILA
MRITLTPFQQQPSYASPLIQAGSVDTALKDPFKLPQKPRFLVWDCMLTMELAKATCAFRGMHFVEQVRHMRYVILPATLLSEIYYSHEMSPGKFVTPDGVAPAEIKMGEMNISNIAMCLRQMICYKQIMDYFKNTELTYEELVLLRATIFHFPGSIFLSAYKVLEQHIRKKLGESAVQRRIKELNKLAVRMFEIADHMKMLHLDFHIKFGNRMFDFPVFESIIVMHFDF